MSNLPKVPERRDSEASACTQDKPQPAPSASVEAINKRKRALEDVYVRNNPGYVPVPVKSQNHVCFNTEPENRRCRRLLFAETVKPFSKYEVISFAKAIYPLVPFRFEVEKGGIRDLLSPSTLYPKAKPSSYQVLFPLSTVPIYTPPKPFSMLLNCRVNHVTTPLAQSMQTGIVKFGERSDDQARLLIQAIDRLLPIDGEDDVLRGLGNPKGYYAEAASLIVSRSTVTYPSYEDPDFKRVITLVETRKCYACDKPIAHHTWHLKKVCKCSPYEFLKELRNKGSYFRIKIIVTLQAITVLKERKNLRIDSRPRTAAKYRHPMLSWGPTNVLSDQRVAQEDDPVYLDYKRNDDFSFIALRLKNKASKKTETRARIRDRREKAFRAINTWGVHGFMPHIAAHPANLEWRDR